MTVNQRRTSGKLAITAVTVASVSTVTLPAGYQRLIRVTVVIYDGHININLDHTGGWLAAGRGQQEGDVCILLHACVPQKRYVDDDDDDDDNRELAAAHRIGSRRD